MENTTQSQMYSINDSEFESIFSDNTSTPETQVETTTEETTTQPIVDNVDKDLTPEEIEAIFKGEDVSEENTDLVEDSKESGIQSTGDNQSSVLKNITEYYIQKGIWVDFEDKDTIDYTNETFEEIVAFQDQMRLESLIESTGDYGKAIIEYTSNGGNPQDILNLFQEQKEISSFDISTEENQRSLLETYYTENLGFTSERAAKVIKSLEIEGELEAESQHAKQVYEDMYAEEINNSIARQEQAQKELIESKEQYDSMIINTLSTSNDYTVKEKNLIQKQLFDYENVEGQVVNNFYKELQRIQQDPKEYLDLVYYVTNKENFIKKLSQKENTKAVEKNFNFIKNNTSTNKNTGSTTIQQETGSTFKFY